MERYNLLLMGTGNQGIRVLTTESYTSLIEENPGLKHQNQGDFYSGISIEDLPERIYDSIDREAKKRSVDNNTVIVESEDFDTNTCNPDLDYIIKEGDGVTIFSPAFRSRDSAVTDNSYLLIANYFIEDLFYDPQEGSLQRDRKIKSNGKNLSAVPFIRTPKLRRVV